MPNRSDFCGKDPDADLFALQGPEIGPKITKKVRISGSRFEISSFAVKLDVKWWLWKPVDAPASLLVQNLYRPKCSLTPVLVARHNEVQY